LITITQSNESVTHVSTFGHLIYCSITNWTRTPEDMWKHFSLSNCAVI